MPASDTHIELQPVSNSTPGISDQLSPQIIQEILKASGVISGTKCYVRHQPRLLNCTKLKFFPTHITFPYGLQSARSGNANQELLTFTKVLVNYFWNYFCNGS